MSFSEAHLSLYFMDNMNNFSSILGWHLYKIMIPSHERAYSLLSFNEVHLSLYISDHINNISLTKVGHPSLSGKNGAFVNDLRLHV